MDKDCEHSSYERDALPRLKELFAVDVRKKHHQQKNGQNESTQKPHDVLAITPKELLCFFRLVTHDD
jgi:hypothetical protein